jgi:hypothetical protein
MKSYIVKLRGKTASTEYTRIYHITVDYDDCPVKKAKERMRAVHSNVERLIFIICLSCEPI